MGRKKLRKRPVDPLVIVNTKTIKTVTPQKCDVCGEKGMEFRYEFLHFVVRWRRTCPKCLAKVGHKVVAV